ncbi:MAG: type II secretion system F family protein [Candidatus Nanohaloarchaeota archaeon]|nr:type II secretion system F family protein [Candidatus Nanohaloarchaeota archaeon]
MKKRKGKLEEWVKQQDWNFIILAFASTFSALILLLVNIQIISKLEGSGAALLANIINALALIVFLLPPTIYKYVKYLQAKAIEDNFPTFLRNIVEGLRSGMDLNKAVIYASRSHYGKLDEYVKGLVVELSWGVPFNKAMARFAEKTKNPLIKRVIATVLEAYRSGGNLADVLESVTQSTFEIDRIKKERKASIHGQMVQGYFIFIIFIAVMIGMKKFLIPALSTSGGDSQSLTINTELYNQLFTHLGVIQGIFSGLVIGKLAEGKISAGFRHSIIMSLIAYITLTVI